MVRRESTRRLSESRSQSPQSVTTSAPAPVAGGQEVLVVPRQRQTRAGYGEVKSCEGSQSCSPLAVRTLPCSQVLCANQNCWFLVDDDSSCGGYCCRKRHSRHTVSPRGSKAHDWTCKKLSAPQGASGALPTPPSLAYKGEDSASATSSDEEIDDDLRPQLARNLLQNRRRRRWLGMRETQARIRRKKRQPLAAQSCSVEQYRFSAGAASARYLLLQSQTGRLHMLPCHRCSPFRRELLWPGVHL